jgi:hypothetical protein
MKLFLALLLISSSSAMDANANAITNAPPVGHKIGEACADKALICAALDECKTASAGKANWGANKCDSVKEGPCKVYCADRVAKMNSRTPAKACPACNKGDFTPEDGNCEGFLKATQTGEKGPKQVAMMKYCQIKASKAKEDGAKLARQDAMLKTVEKGHVAQMIAAQKDSKFKALRGSMEVRSYSCLRLPLWRCLKLPAGSAGSVVYRRYRPCLYSRRVLSLPSLDRVTRADDGLFKLLIKSCAVFCATHSDPPPPPPSWARTPASPRGTLHVV